VEKTVGYQFTGDAFVLPGVTDEYTRRMPLDVNLFRENFLMSIKEPINFAAPVVVPITPPVIDTSVSVVGKYIVTVSALNIRKGPGTSYDLAGPVLPNKTVVDVVSISGDWAKLVSGYYCFAPYLVTVTPRPVTGEKYFVNCSALNIRTGPGVTYSFAGVAMLKNTVVSVVEVMK